MMNSREYALQASGSFALPDACFKVKALMADENSAISDFADVISIDPSMTSRLLQIANSAIYHFPGEISTISRAITVIGTQAIYNMMLVDVAELLVAKISPEIAECCEKYNHNNLPWDLQELALGFTYTEISAELLKIWQLPEKIIIPIRHFNQAQSNQINKDVKVLNLASRLALLDSYVDKFDYDTVIDQSLCQSLGLSKDDINQVADIAAEDAIGILTVMNPKLFSR